jgi:hypothetical protein
MLTYLFNHKIFRNKCPKHKANYEIYKKIESLKARNDSIASAAGSFKSASFRERFLDKNPYIDIDKSEELIYKKMTRLLNRQRRFKLKVNKYVDEFNTTTISGAFEPRALFSKSLLRECHRFFISQINQYQVTEKPAESVVREKIEKYNSEHYDKLPKNEMLKFFAMLKNSSFEELMKANIYSRATFYRYKNRFAKIGITQNNIMPIDFIHPVVDLSTYHHQMLYGNKLINK